MKDGFVVIYDRDDHETEETVEEYFGYFNTPEEAKREYKILVGDDPTYHSAHLCKIVEEIS